MAEELAPKPWRDPESIPNEKGFKLLALMGPHTPGQDGVEVECVVDWRPLPEGHYLRRADGAGVVEAAFVRGWRPVLDPWEHHERMIQNLVHLHGGLAQRVRLLEARLGMQPVAALAENSPERVIALCRSGLAALKTAGLSVGTVWGEAMLAAEALIPQLAAQAQEAAAGWDRSAKVVEARVRDLDRAQEDIQRIQRERDARIDQSALLEKIRTRLVEYKGDVNLLTLLGEITTMVAHPDEVEAVIARQKQTVRERNEETARYASLRLRAQELLDTPYSPGPSDIAWLVDVVALLTDLTR